VITAVLDEGLELSYVRGLEIT